MDERRRLLRMFLSAEGESRRYLADRLWQDAGSEARLEALWELVLAAHERTAGFGGDFPRLVKSAICVIRPDTSEPGELHEP